MSAFTSKQGRAGAPVVVGLLTLGLVVAAVMMLSGGRSAGLADVREKARAGQFGQAIEDLKLYLRDHPDDPTAHLLMGQLATEADDPHPSMALEHLARLHPKDAKETARIRFLEGKAEYFRERYDLAEERWKDALKLDPVVAEAGWALMDLLDKEGRVEEAHALGMRLVEVEPDPLDRARILLNVGRLDIDVVNPASQVLMFQALWKAHPENLPIGLTVGQALVRDSRGADGLKVLEDVLHRHPDSPEAWDAWLTGLSGAFRADRLAGELAKLPRTMADDPRFAEPQGMVALAARDWPGAVRAFRRAAEFEPFNGIVWYRLRAALRAVGDREGLEKVDRWYTSFEEAFKAMRPAYQEALAVPTLGVRPNPGLYHRLADLRERMGRPDEALAWHRMVLRDDPNDTISRQAIGQLKPGNRR